MFTPVLLNKKQSGYLTEEKKIERKHHIVFPICPDMIEKKEHVWEFLADIVLWAHI